MMQWPWVSRRRFDELQADYGAVWTAFEGACDERRQVAVEVAQLRRRLDAYDAATARRARDEEEAQAALLQAMQAGKVVAIASWRTFEDEATGRTG
jgi:hypothetical protein